VNRVLKYPLTVAGQQVVQMPVTARVVHVAAQHGVPTVWALHSEPAASEPRRFFIFGTGHTFDRMIDGHDLEHRGSVLLQSGGLVLHIFEAVPETPF
jgi:hypothetical protein